MIGIKVLPSHMFSHGAKLRWFVSLATAVCLCRMESHLSSVAVASTQVPVTKISDIEKVSSPGSIKHSNNREFDMPLGRSHQGPNPGERNEQGRSSYEENELGVHFEGQSLADLEIDGASVTWDLHGCVRPRPNDVKILRSPFSGMVAHIFAWPGELVSEDDLLVAFIIPEQFDWIETIFSSQNELQRLGRLEGLLSNEGQAKAIELIGEIVTATARMKKVQAELELLEVDGPEDDGKREFARRQGEVEEASAEVIGLRSLAQTYGIDLERIASCESEEKIADLSNGAMPAEIRGQIEMIQFSRSKAIIASDIAKAKLKILGTKGEQIEGLRAQIQDPLKSAFTARAAGPGIVTHVNITPPTPVTPEEEIMRLVDYRKVHVEIRIPEVDISKVRNRGSDTLFVRAEGLADKIFRGEVVYFDTEVDAKDRTSRLVVEVENTKDMILRDGMAVLAGIP